MLKEYPRFERGQIQEFYSKLPKEEQQLFSDYITYRQARGLNNLGKAQDTRRYLLHLRFILEKPLTKIDLRDLRGMLSIINSSWLADIPKNMIKADLKNFLKYLFPDWSLRFASLEDIKLDSKPSRKRPITPQILFKKEDIENIMLHETKMFWKAFFICQYEGGLRTGEVRFLKWDDIKFNVDGDLSEVSIYATKTKRNRIIFVKEATHYLQRLKQEQESLNQKGAYIFHAARDKNKPVDKHVVSNWFRHLTKKVLNRESWNYLLRHSRGTELRRLVKQGKMSKDTSIAFMGHSEKMNDSYSHFEDQEIKEILKNQVYKLEDLPEDKKNELEIEIEKLKEENKNLKAGFGRELNNLKKDQDEKISELSSRITKIFGAAKQSSSLNKIFLKAIEQDKNIVTGIRRHVKKPEKAEQPQQAHP